MIRTLIVEEARRWIGTPYQHQASKREVGCDCIGLVRGVARAVGFQDPFETGDAREFTGYGASPDPARLRAAVARFLNPIGRDAASCGDIMLMRFKREPQHFALLIERHPDRMIHSLSTIGRVVETHVAGQWLPRVLGFYRFKELAA